MYLTGSDSDWLLPLIRKLDVANRKEEQFAQDFRHIPESGPGRAEYLRRKWKHLNDLDIEFLRRVSKKGCQSLDSRIGDENVYLPSVVSEILERVGSFSGAHKWMQFSLFDPEELLSFRKNEDVGRFLESRHGSLVAYRRFATIGLLPQAQLLIRLSRSQRPDDLVISFNYETGIARVVSDGFRTMIRAVNYCIEHDVAMNVERPRARYKSWLLEQQPSDPSEFFRQNGTKFRFDAVHRLSGDLNRMLFD